MNDSIPEQARQNLRLWVARDGLVLSCGGIYTPEGELLFLTDLDSPVDDEADGVSVYLPEVAMGDTMHAQSAVVFEDYYALYPWTTSTRGLLEFTINKSGGLPTLQEWARTCRKNHEGEKGCENAEERGVPR